MGRRFRVIAVLGVTFIDFVYSQTTTLGVSTTYNPTNSWAAAPTCSLGSGYGGPAPYGGYYQDQFGQYYEMQCGYAFSGTTYYDGTYVGTTGQGVNTCFFGCSQRAGCMGFTYSYTSQSTGNTGAGRCFHFFNGTQGTLGPATGVLIDQAVYGSAYLLQAAPGAVCPYYDGQTFNDFNGVSYSAMCGYRAATTTAGAAQGAVPVATTLVPNIQSCLSACDVAGTTSCGHAAYSYTPIAEPAGYTNPHNFGQCTFFTGTPTPSGGGSAHYHLVMRVTSAASSTLAVC